MQHLRAPAVAGSFYPADPDELRATIAQYLAACTLPAVTAPGNAIIVPHAGYIYSGPVAAAAYAAIAPLAGQIRKVIIIGPAHRVRVRGIAISSAEAFVTPLGAVPVSDSDRNLLLHQAAVSVGDAAHEFEHSLEVQLPFLQSICSSFQIVPLVVGDASPDEVQKALEPFWGDPQTLIVVSTDLSHFHDYETARQRDAETVERFVELDYENIHGENACGCRAVNGLLRLLTDKSGHLRVLSIANSGDTAGPRDRVVGYGSFIVDDA